MAKNIRLSVTRKMAKNYCPKCISFRKGWKVEGDLKICPKCGQKVKVKQ